MRIWVERDVCVGHARCFAVSPEVYEIDDDGFSHPVAPDVGVELADNARRGAAACPEKAIIVEEP
ncbi:ferredoxin [Amycolatopsis japonica]|uniref:ferredoxin n=1 Tax=Amycolatopsis japonica TaxID=208439 RepID=UPI00366C6FD8